MYPRRLVRAVHPILAADQCGTRRNTLCESSIGHGHRADDSDMTDMTHNKCGIRCVAENGTCIITHET
ncbi:protein of unknown function [Methylorubrum extorquens]|uniref:Uncharacterized protein n=1 Tax=Methylorubrum extorquens TaxID=408 RepID=A0A2N9AZ14_METEX|nr:protein of unknown function [Methylorubrum extorquens]